MITQKNSVLCSTLQFTEVKCRSLQSVLLPLTRDHNVLRPVDPIRFLTPKRIVGDYLIEKRQGKCWFSIWTYRLNKKGLLLVFNSPVFHFWFCGFTADRNYDLTNVLVLEKLTGLRQIKEFPAFYATRRFVNEFSRARHLSVSYAI